MMFNFGNVQAKISCVFQTNVVLNVDSRKRTEQSYRVIATDRLRERAAAILLDQPNSYYLPTEKLDGTCCMVKEFRGRPWLWARHDRKPTKAAEKHFRTYQNEHPKSLTVEGAGDDCAGFVWNVERDFKDVPSDWIPSGNKEDGLLLPDPGGHIPGWVPVDPTSRQHCWHLSSVDLDKGVALVLQPNSTRPGHLEIVLHPMTELVGSTMELIGTNINANPYHLGSKSRPLHLLIQHGTIPVDNVPPTNSHDLKDWFLRNPDGSVEGIVWHCLNNEMYKLHRHHFSLEWPLPKPKLLLRPVAVNIALHQHIDNNYTSQLISHFVKLSGQTFDSLAEISFDGV